MKFKIIDDDSNFSVQLKYDLYVHFKDYVNIEDIEILTNDFYKINLIDTDVIFIDIDLEKFDGIELSTQIRNIYPALIIIFISSHENLVFNTLVVRPFQFIRKSKYNEDKYIVFRLLKKHLDMYYRNIILTIKGRMVKINITKIIYCISLGHELTIHTESRDYVIAKSILQFLNLLDSTNFVQIQRNVIINLSYSKEVTKKFVLLSPNYKFNIGRKYQKNLLEYYKKYLLTK